MNFIGGHIANHIGIKLLHVLFVYVGSMCLLYDLIASDLVEGSLERLIGFTVLGLAGYFLTWFLIG